MALTRGKWIGINWTFKLGKIFLATSTKYDVIYDMKLEKRINYANYLLPPPLPLIQVERANQALFLAPSNYYRTAAAATKLA